MESETVAWVGFGMMTVSYIVARMQLVRARKLGIQWQTFGKELGDAVMKGKGQAYMLREFVTRLPRKDKAKEDE